MSRKSLFTVKIWFGVYTILFREIISLELLPSLDLDDGKSVLHNGRTLAHIEIIDNVSTCELSIVDESVKDEELQKFEAKNVTVVSLEFSQMMEIIPMCEKLADMEDVNIRIDSEVVEESGFWDSFVSSFRTVSLGIAPGTLWCGIDDIAPSYKSLGTNRKLDKCCRAHDFCPDKIKPGATKGGIENKLKLKTISNCECEQIFHSCLKSVDSLNANSVGFLYFSSNRECIEMRHPKRCLEWDFTNKTENIESEKSEDFIFEDEEEWSESNGRIIHIENPNFNDPLKFCTNFTEDINQPMTLQVAENLRY